MLIYLLCFTISLIYPFLTYGIQVWGLTYPTYLKPVTTLHKRVVRRMTFSDPRSHSEPLLKSLRLPKFSDIIHLDILSFVYQWYHKLSPSCFVLFSPSIFNSFFLYTSITDWKLICLLNWLFRPHSTAFVLSVTLVQNFENQVVFQFSSTYQEFCDWWLKYYCWFLMSYNYIILTTI